VADRAILFVDGNNWYHGLKDAGVENQADLDHRKIAKKLVGPRIWTGTRYYIGQVQQIGNVQLYADQRRFLAGLQAADRRISVHLGRLETRTLRNDCAVALHEYLSRMPVRIDPVVFRELMALASQHRSAKVMVEKAIDVMLAVDLVTMAQTDDYDTAYVLSADPSVPTSLETVPPRYLCTEWRRMVPGPCPSRIQFLVERSPLRRASARGVSPA
jgi:uncharacterized LabA/DUF88 family protein